MKLLIVDDNASVRELIRCFFVEPAVEITECADGAEALAAYDTLQPDWVLMDVQMPRLNGLEATRRIRAAHPQARIIIVSRFDDEELRAEAREAGACDYVLKAEMSRLPLIVSPAQQPDPAIQVPDPASP